MGTPCTIFLFFPQIYNYTKNKAYWKNRVVHESHQKGNCTCCKVSGALFLVVIRLRCKNYRTRVSVWVCPNADPGPRTRVESLRGCKSESWVSEVGRGGYIRVRVWGQCCSRGHSVPLGPLRSTELSTYRWEPELFISPSWPPRLQGCSQVA